MRSAHNRLAVALASLLVAAADAATWHVSTAPLPGVDAAVQVRSISDAAAVVAAGDLVLIHSGVYREAITVEPSGTPKQPIRFVAAPNAEVTITGADIKLDWQDEGEGVFSVEWPHRFLGWTKRDAHPDDDYHRLIGRPEQVIANGYSFRQTLTRESLSPGSFFVDGEAHRLFLMTATGRSPTSGDETIETATRPVLFFCKGDYIELRGFHFRHAANHAQQGAVFFTGRGDVLEDCVIERTSGIGASFQGPDQRASRCTFQDNGALGFTGYHAHNLRVTDCIAQNNTTKAFNRDWEAGGAKVVLSRGVVIERSQFLANRGPGIWFDLGNENCAVRNCLIAENEGAGIFYEISYGLHAFDNVIVGNGLAPDPRRWGAQAGISISSSPDCVVQRNLLVANREGFCFREQPRTTPRIDHEGAKDEAIWNHDELIKNNIIADNTDAQTAGWFASDDERHWPQPLQTRPSPECLRDLHLCFQGNVYAADDNRPLFVWGPLFARHVTYRNLSRVQSELGLEQGSRVTRIQFRNYAARDFRLQLQGVADLMKGYPRGTVPGVALDNLPPERSRRGTEH